MNPKLSLLAIGLALMVFTSCNDNKKKQNNNDCKNIHWSHHKGEESPENWKNLCDGFSDCGGSLQSPVNIVTKNVIKEGNLVGLSFNYGKSKVEIINNLHTVQFNIESRNKIKFNEKDYELLQFHYHSLSEHTVDGVHFPLEAHFVHKYSDTDYAVLAVMFVEGKENVLLKKYVDHFPVTKGKFVSDDMIDLLSLFPENKSYYSYKGSLTTPPCSEVVTWVILQTPVEASKEQLATMSNILNNNYRPVLPLNDREVQLYIDVEK